MDDGEEFGRAWAAPLLEQTRKDCDRLLIGGLRENFRRLDRMDTITRYLRRLIGSVDEGLMSLSETMAEGSAGATSIADAFDSTAMALEYLAEIERLSDELLRIGEPETATDSKRVSREAVSD